MVAQLVEDLVHLEGGGDGLDQHGGPDRAPVQAEGVLGREHDVVPQPGLEMALQLGQVEVRARIPGTGSPGRCGTRTARSRTGWPTSARRRRGSASPAGASPGAARPGWRSRRPGGRSCPAVTSSIVPRTASCRLTWPAMTLSQVGELASSKSAMKTLAPELRALIIILRSTGPVISTRRSASGLGASGTVQLAGADVERCSARKSGRSPASKRAWRSARAASSSSRRASNGGAGRPRSRPPAGSGPGRRPGAGVKRDVRSATSPIMEKNRRLVESNILIACALVRRNAKLSALWRPMPSIPWCSASASATSAARPA